MFMNRIVPWVAAVSVRPTLQNADVSSIDVVLSGDFSAGPAFVGPNLFGLAG